MYQIDLESEERNELHNLVLDINVTSPCTNIYLRDDLRFIPFYWSSSVPSLLCPIYHPKYHSQYSITAFTFKYVRMGYIAMPPPPG
jgi:hypothetical protein